MDKLCTISNEEFAVPESDLSFYQRVAPRISGQRFDMPPPTLSPYERRRRRYSHRNERTLYRRECGLSKKPLVSNLGRHTGIPVYEQTAWWSDNWSAKTYGREYDFSRAFFEQYQELQADVPQLALIVLIESQYHNSILMFDI